MKKSIKTLLITVVGVMIFSLAVSATGMNNRMTERTGENDMKSSQTENTDQGNIDSGSDGNIDENGSSNSGSLPNAVESVVTGAVNDVSDAVNSAENAVNDATDGNMWGIIIAIAIIGGLAALLFVLLRRK